MGKRARRAFAVAGAAVLGFWLAVNVSLLVADLLGVTPW
jgi:hypothetical protein